MTRCGMLGAKAANCESASQPAIYGGAVYNLALLLACCENGDQLLSAGLVSVQRLYESNDAK